MLRSLSSRVFRFFACRFERFDAISTGREFRSDCARSVFPVDSKISSADRHKVRRMVAGICSPDSEDVERTIFRGSEARFDKNRLLRRSEPMEDRCSPSMFHYGF